VCRFSSTVGCFFFMNFGKIKLHQLKTVVPPGTYFLVPDLRVLCSVRLCLCVISGCHCEVAETCALLGYYSLRNNPDEHNFQVVFSFIIIVHVSKYDIFVLYTSFLPPCCT